MLEEKELNVKFIEFKKSTTLQCGGKRRVNMQNCFMVKREMAAVFVAAVAIALAWAGIGLAQQGNPGAYGGFGIDGDVYADTTERPLGEAGLDTDDWFDPVPHNPGTGVGVIDTTGAGAIRAYLSSAGNAVARNVSFSRGMALGLSPDYLAAVYGRDNINAGGAIDSTIFGGTSDKNADNPRTWNLGAGSTPQKNDFVDVAAHLKRDGTGLLWLYAMSTTRSADGASHLDIEFFSADTRFINGELVNLGPDSGHTAWRFSNAGEILTPGDVIISTDFTQGGVTPHFSVRVWIDLNDPNNANGPFTFTGVVASGGTSAAGFGYAEIEIPSVPIEAVIGVVNIAFADSGNGNTLGAPWGSLEGPQASFEDSIQTLQLTEIGVNLTQFNLDIDPEIENCQLRYLGNIMFKTRSSQEFTAELKDFVGPFFFGTELEPPVCSITGDSEICAGFSTEFCATPGMASYEWSGPGGFTATTECTGAISDAGTYTVIITDENGCADTCSQVLTVNDQPVCAITGDNEICAGFTTEFCATPGMASYEWSGPGGFTATTECTGAISDAGTYTVIITDENGCADTCSQVLTVNDQPVCAITGDNEICAGFTTEFCATPGMASYEWSGPGGFTATTECTGEISAAGTYTVIITDENGCADTCSETLTVNDQPVCDITGDNEICEGFTTEFCATPGMASYEWSGPGGFTATTECTGEISAAGTYTVIITDENGCADTCSETLTVNDQPVCAITGDNEICEGFTTEFCATPGMASYEWSGPGGFTATTECTGEISAAGTYTVIITDENGCADTCSETLTVNDQPVCAITGDNEICIGFTTEFCAPAGMASYDWRGPGGVIVISTEQCTGEISTPGTYTVIITDENGCADTCSRALTVHEQPVCAITGDNEICEGFSTEFCATPGMASYEWTDPAGAVISNNQCTGDISAAGAYTVIITDENGCVDTCSETLTVNERPVCEITGDNEICEGFTAEFCATAGMASYEWTDPAGAVISNNQCTGDISAAGTYTVIITDENGCADTCSETLTVNDQPVCAITGDNEICEGFTTEFCATPGMASYEWSGPGGFTATTECTGDISAAGTYTVIITDENGCADTCSETLTVNDQPVCAITGDNEICEGFTTAFCATPGMASYEWSGPGGFTATTECTGDISAAGTYTVIITDENGCADTCSETLTVNDQPVCAITGDNEICEGFTTEFCATPGMASYEWTDPAGAVISNNQCTGDISAAGTYTVIITDENGCADTCSETLTVNDQPVCAITGDNEICEGFTTEFCATPGMASYEWSGPGGFTASTQCTGEISEAGTYTVIITDENGCADTCSERLVVNEQPVCAITGDNEICEGFTTEFCATPGMTSYEWSGPGGFTASTQCTGEISEAGEYTVIITDENGCADTCSETLTVNERPVCEITGDNEICEGFTAEFCAIAGMTSYEWSGPGGFTGSSRCTGPIDEPGFYEVIVTDENGCADTCVRELIVHDRPVCEITGDNEICEGFTTEFCATPGMVSYEWSGPDGFTATTECTGEIGVAGTYAVVITDENGCIDTCWEDLTVHERPICSIEGDTIVCEGQIYSDLCATEGMALYAWSGPNGFTASTQCTGPVDIAGIYEVIITDENGCSDTCSIELFEKCPSEVFCTFTQGFYGNYGGTFNGLTTIEIIDSLITPDNPLVIGRPGRSLTFAEGSEDCIVTRLPGGGPAAMFPSNLGDAVVDESDCSTDPALPLMQGKYRNILLAQTITLALNVRWDTDLCDLTLCPYMVTQEVLCGEDGICGTQDDVPDPGEDGILGSFDDPVMNVTIPEEVFDALDALGLPHTACGLLALADSALSGGDTGGLSLSKVASALDAINEGFDECRFLVSCDQDPPFSYRRPSNLAKGVPHQYSLSQNYPNPFNPETQISYALPHDSKVDLAVYNVLGQRVATLVDDFQAAGVYTVVWNGRDASGREASTGIYFYRIVTSDGMLSRKMVLLK
jgi:hypothetical protein